jgi:hypothetical protein
MMLAKSFSLPSLRTHWVGIALALSLAVNLTFAAGYYTRMQLADRLVQSPADRIQYIQRQLDLKPEQQHAFAQFLHAVGTATHQLREGNEPLAEQLWTELSSDQPDSVVLTRISDEINGNRAQQQRKLLELTVPFLDQLDGSLRTEFLRLFRTQQTPLTRIIRGN